MGEKTEKRIEGIFSHDENMTRHLEHPGIDHQQDYAHTHTSSARLL